MTFNDPMYAEEEGGTQADIWEYRLRHGDPVAETREVEMSLLEKVTVGKQPEPPRIVVYGVDGVGKSTFGAGAPAPLFIDIEGGLGNIDCAKLPKAHNLGDVQKAIRALFTEDHEYKTVVIDSADWLERMIWEEVADEAGVKDISDISYGRGYAAALAKWQPILQFLDKLRDEKGMNVILLAHAKIEKFENPETETYDRYSPRLHKLASALVREWCDAVLFATYQVFTRKSDEGGFRGERVIGVGSGQRILRANDRPAHVAKNRYALPDELPLSWTELEKHINPEKERS